MKVLVSGATGLIGGALRAALVERGDTVVTLTRSPEKVEGEAVGWDPMAGTLEAGALEGIDAVIHLAGENIAAGRWTEAHKAKVFDSRVKGTALIAENLARLAATKPRVFVSASAIGIYGDRGSDELTEEASSGETYLAEVCVAWEEAAEAARNAGIRVVHPRIGIVLSPKGGALEKMLLPFKLGLGGKVGPGTQYMSWVSLEDVVGLLLFALDRDDLHGPLNVVAPNPVTNGAYTAALGQALRRPTLLPVPSVGLRWVLGEMADELLLLSARVLPKKAQDLGYPFRFSELEPYLKTILG